MGVFTRFRDIVNANINAMLDKAEDPEKMIRLMIQEMEDTLVDMKSSCAAKMADRAELDRDKATLADKADRWDKRARLAVEKGRDDLAREALVEKKAITAQQEQVEKEAVHYDTLIAECKANIQQLEEKLIEVSQKHRILVERAIHAREKKRVRETMRQASGFEAIQRFDDLENRIERMEAEADLAGSSASSRFEDEFARMEAGEKVEEELQALKKSMKGGAPKTAEKKSDA